VGRKLLNHPFTILDELQIIPDELYYSRLTSASGKLCVLERLLAQLLSNQHKCLIFSQFTETLNILEDFLTMRDIKFVRLDGTYY
jgi:SNF2 family DNA or RNA helicase